MWCDNTVRSFKEPEYPYTIDLEDGGTLTVMNSPGMFRYNRENFLNMIDSQIKSGLIRVKIC